MGGRCSKASSGGGRPPRVLQVSHADLGPLARVGQSFARSAPLVLEPAGEPVSLRLARVSRQEASVAPVLDGLSFVARFRSTSPAGSGGLALGSKLALALLERGLGGEFRPEQPDRLLTPLEEGLLAELVGPLLAAWEEAWEGAACFRLSDPVPPLPASGSRQPWIHWRWERADRDDPAFFVEACLDEETAFSLACACAPSVARHEAALRAVMAEAPADVRLEAGRAVLPLAELARLAPGTFVPLETSTADAWDVMVGSHVLACGHPVTVGGVPHLLLTRTSTEESRT